MLLHLFTLKYLEAGGSEGAHSPVVAEAHVQEGCHHLLCARHDVTFLLLFLTMFGRTSESDEMGIKEGPRMTVYKAPGREQDCRNLNLPRSSVREIHALFIF